MNTISFKKQSGVILIVSLIMLLLLTIIGVTGTQVTALEEKMANNSRDQNLSFQASEAALRSAEEKIDALPAITLFDGSNKWLLGEDTEIPPLSTMTWNDNDSFEFQSDIQEISTQPRYFIKYVGDNSTANINNYAYGEAGNSVISYFVVTSQGTGAQDTSQTYLRLYYARKFIN